MNDDELNKALDLIIDLLNKSDLSITSKTELMINISKFLQPKYYKENIKDWRKRGLRDEC